MRVTIFSAILLAAVAPAVAATLSADQAKKIFFGYDMAGYLAGENTKWHECIHPDGTTTYWFAGTIDDGRLRIRDDGVLCFSYKSTNYQNEGCFTAQRNGSNWRFTDENDPSTVFVTTHTRSVKACPTKEPAIS
jgi:hypothetical protein